MGVHHSLVRIVADKLEYNPSSIVQKVSRYNGNDAMRTGLKNDGTAVCNSEIQPSHHQKLLLPFWLPEEWQ